MRPGEFGSSPGVTGAMPARSGPPPLLSLSLDEPAAEAATLTVETAGDGCPVDGSDQAIPGGERRFAQLLDLSPR